MSITIDKSQQCVYRSVVTTFAHTFKLNCLIAYCQLQGLLSLEFNSNFIFCYNIIKLNNNQVLEFYFMSAFKLISSKMKYKPHLKK